MQNYTTHVPPVLSDSDKRYLESIAYDGLVKAEWLRLNGRNEIIRKHAGAMSEAYCSMLRFCGHDIEKLLTAVQQEVNDGIE